MADKHDRTQELFGIVKEVSRLIEGDEVVMPSLVELLGNFHLADAIEIDRLIKWQAEMYASTAAQRSFARLPDEFVAFIIPLDSYIPLPDDYAADRLFPDGKGGIAKASLVSVSSVSPNIVLRDDEMRLRLTVMFAALGDHEYTTKTIRDLGESGSLFTMYEHALDAINDTILAYKLAPRRHNHDLGLVTMLNRPSLVDVIRFRISDRTVLERERVAMHKNALAALFHARNVEGVELNAFRSLHWMLGEQHRIENLIISKLYQAIDARCKGNHEIAIVLADTFTEHALRYLLFPLLLITMDSEHAGKRIDELRTLTKLLKSFAGMLSIERKELEARIDFAEWNKKCRKFRNSLTHRFLEQSVSGLASHDAIAASSNMIYKLIEVIGVKYQDTSGVALQLLKSVGWYRDYAQTREGGPEDGPVGEPQFDGST